MKGNKKILVIAGLLLLIAASYTTYAIYRTSINGTGTANAAGWQIAFEDGEGTTISDLNFTGADVDWDVNPSAVSGKIAPGASGYLDFTIDATGSEVDVYYLAELGAGATSGITVTLVDPNNSNAVLNGEQLLRYAASDMTASVRLKVEWAGTLEDTTTKDSSDMALAGESISLPITITARQSLNNPVTTP